MKRFLRKSYSTLKEKDIYFKCTGCGKCCQIEGICIISNEDVSNISKFLKLKNEDFLKEYTTKYIEEDGTEEIILKDKNNSNDCIFLDEDKKCKIYPARPLQCSSYPFWNSILKSKKTWEDEAKECEGIKIFL